MLNMAKIENSKSKIAASIKAVHLPLPVREMLTNTSAVVNTANAPSKNIVKSGEIDGPAIIRGLATPTRTMATSAKTPAVKIATGIRIFLLSFYVGGNWRPIKAGRKHIVDLPGTGINVNENILVESGRIGNTESNRTAFFPSHIGQVGL